DGEAISIRNLKRFVTDRVDPSVFKPEKSILDEEEIKKVAVVGAGPAGLSAAHYLSLKGYKVTIFDAEEKPGGLLLKGIPSYRLPRDVLNRDIESLMNENITFKGKTFFGTDITVKSLFDTGFNAVFIAIGSHQSLRLKIDGEDFEGVYPSMYFLRGHNLENKNLAKGNVGVIGGGNSAIDAARIAIRQEGVESVKIFYRRTRNEMPAIDEEIEAALEEGVKLETLISPERIVSENGRLKQVEFIRNILGESDKSGRRRPLPVIGSDHLVEIDTLIVAISEEPDKSAIAQDGLELTDWGTVKIDADTLATSIPGVFAGGDVVTGPNTVVDAIAAGKNAALTIERYLCGRDLRQTPQVNLPEIYIPQAIVDEEEETVEFHRPETPSVEVELRRKSFMEVEKSLSVENAEREARRCLRCDLEFTQKKI
ncbi:MAG TPA: FAD-dependent oxidoreductase, partial [Desulfobacteraceae bacterium]|nr:FAD-dependent oxidoreductase [Desulfobacteraceae bacterium]